MKYQFIIVILLIGINKKSTCQDIFEGIITYKTETQLKKKNHPYNEYFSQKFGDTLRVSISKNGNMKREYLGSGGLGFDWAIYNQEKNEFYSKWKSMDSIFYYNCSETVTELKSFELLPGSKKILGKDCQSIIIHSLEPNLQEKITHKYYFSGEEKIIENTFEEFKDGYLDRVYSLSKSHILQWEFEQDYVKVKFKAISIEWKPINNEVFIIPEGIPFVKM